MTDTKPAAPINLAEARLRRGLSQVKLAEAIGVKPDVIRTAENGGRPNPGNAVAIAEFFGLDVVVQWPLPRRVVIENVDDVEGAAA